MAFVFSFWYIIAILLVAGIAACLVVFFKMDKKDTILIDEFIKSQQPAEETKAEETVVEENKANE
ncbi:MAG: hypothetical protein IJW36_01780 [Clostridia bacterium]|nr:hypothetical protein [Clostridia bacterium]